MPASRTFAPHLAALGSFLLAISFACSAQAAVSLVPAGSAFITVGCYDIKTADLDGDGRPEAVAGIADTRQIAVIRNDGAGHLVGVDTYPDGVVQAVALQDFTGDGLIDVLSADWFQDYTPGGSQGIMTLHANLGGGNLGPPLTWSMGTHPRDVVGADVDGNGKLDAVVVTGTGQMVIRLGQGGGAFGTITTPVAIPGGLFKAVDAGDIDHDGDVDIVIVDYHTSMLRPYLNTGGTFVAGVTRLLGDGASDLKLADLDGDGWLDAAVANEDGTCNVLHNLAGTFEPALSFGVGQLSQSIDVADFDVDGKPDLLVSNWSQSTVSVLRNLGGMAFTPEAVASCGVNPRGAAAGDFDGDGRPDVIAGNFTGGTAELLRNAPAYPQAVLNTPSLEFGTAYLTEKTTLSVSVQNLGGSILQLTPAPADNPEFTVLAGALINVAPGTTVQIGVRYERSQLGEASGSFHLATNDTTAPDLVITLHGTSAQPFPRAELLTPDLDFGTQFTGIPTTLQAAIRNGGPLTLVVQPGVSDNPEYAQVAPVGQLLVPPGQTRTVSVQYARSQDGAAEGTLHLATNDTLASDLAVALHGFAGPPPVANASGPDPVTVAVGAQAHGTVRVRNLGVSPLHLVVTPDFLDLAETSALDMGPTTEAFLRADQGEALWDLQPDGSVGTGSDGSYLGGMDLAGFPAFAGAVLGLGGREYRLGPVTVGSLQLTRKMYVSPEHGFARFVDVAENKTASNKTWTYDLTDNLGYAQIAPLRTSSGDNSFSTADDWIVIPPDDVAGRRAVGRVHRTVGAPTIPTLADYQQTSLPNTFTRTKYVLTIPPRRRAAIVGWAIQAPDTSTAFALAADIAAPSAEAFEHIDAIDRMTAANAVATPGVFVIATGPHVVTGGDSLDLDVTFDADLAWHASEISGLLRLTTDDPTHPELLVPLAMSVTGGAVVGIDPPPTKAVSLALAGLFPNPGRLGDRVRVAFRLPGAERATLALYDVRGRLIARHVLEHPAPGPGSIDLGRSLAPGVILMRLEQGGHAVTAKGIVLH